MTPYQLITALRELVKALDAVRDDLEDGAEFDVRWERVLEATEAAREAVA